MCVIHSWLTCTKILVKWDWTNIDLSKTVMLMSRHTSKVFLISSEENRGAINLMKVGKLHYE